MYQICIFVSSAWYALDSSEPSLLKFNIFSRNNTVFLQYKEGTAHSKYVKAKVYSSTAYYTIIV